jgi:hypothetical protein
MKQRIIFSRHIFSCKTSILATSMNYFSMYVLQRENKGHFMVQSKVLIIDFGYNASSKYQILAHKFSFRN